MWTDAARVKYLFAVTFVLSCLALGLILWWVSSGTLSSREIGQEAREHRDHLLHSLTNGSVLYQKLIYYTPNARTQNVIEESWSRIGKDTEVVEAVGKVYDAESGKLVSTSVARDGTNTFTDVIRGESMTTPFSPYKLSGWLSRLWTYPQRLENEGEYTSQGRGSLAGKDSLIYSKTKTIPSGHGLPERTIRREVEVVSDEPVLHRTSTYDASGVKISESAWIEYGVLSGDQMPNIE